MCVMVIMMMTMKRYFNGIGTQYLAISATASLLPRPRRGFCRWRFQTIIFCLQTVEPSMELADAIGLFRAADSERIKRIRNLRESHHQIVDFDV